MKAFNKRETLIQNICFMSFFVAINVIGSLLSVYVPIASIIIIIFLPLTSSIVEVMCKDKYFPIYALATIGLSIVVSLQSIDFTLFYVVPSIFTGYIFGFMSKKNLPDMFSVFLATIVQTVLSFSFIPILKEITGTDLIDVLAKIMHISHRIWYETAIILIFFAISLIQVILSFIVCETELEKLGEKKPDSTDKTLFADIAILASSAFVVLFDFLYLPLSLLFVGITWYFLAFLVMEQIKSKKLVFFLVDITFVFVGIVLYAAINKYFRGGMDFALFATIPFLISLFSIFHYFLKKAKQ